MKKNMPSVKEALAGTGIKVLAGEAALCEAASLPSAELVLTAIVGSVGLRANHCCY